MKKVSYTICLSVIILITSAAIAADRTTAAQARVKAAPAINPNNIVSAYANFTTAVEQTLLTVPADKHFVLTDIIGQASIEINQGKVTKLKIQLGYSPDNKSASYQNAVSMKTGIVFAPGTEVTVYPFPVGLGKHSSYGYVTLSGYYY